MHYLTFNEYIVKHLLPPSLYSRRNSKIAKTKEGKVVLPRVWFRLGSASKQLWLTLLRHEALRSHQAEHSFGFHACTCKSCPAQLLRSNYSTHNAMQPSTLSPIWIPSSKVFFSQLGNIARFSLNRVNYMT
jgi:hypothetical protein